MRRGLLAALVVLVVLLGTVLLGAGPLLNTAAARERITAALTRATGHPARIEGPVSLAWSAAPAFSLQGVVLANPPGFTGPDFVTARRVAARVALLPLLLGRVEIPSVALDGADVRLERDANGRGNWLSAPAPETGPATTASAPRRPVAIGTVEVSGSRVELPDFPPVLVHTLSVSPGGGPVAGTATVRDVLLTVAGRTEAPGPAGLPFSLTAIGGGLALAASGQAGGPAGSDVAFQASAPDLAAVSPLVGQPLPALRDAKLTGQLQGAALVGLTLTAGDSDAPAVLPGLRLVRLEASAARLDGPVQVKAEGALRALPVALAGSFGPFRAGSGLVAASLAGDGATLAISGTVGPAGLDGTVSARVPDVRRTAALAGYAAPAVHDVALDARAVPAGTARVTSLRGLRLTSAEGDLAGDVAVGLAPRPSLRGSLQSARLDLDVWTVVAPLPAPAPPPSPPSPPSPPPAAAPAIAPERPLPFAALRQADLDVSAAIAQARYRGTDYRSVQLHIVLADGRLRVDPATATAPGGPMRLTLQADAGAAPPTAALTLRGQGLNAAGLSELAGAPGALTGTVDADIDLKGAGVTARAMAASVTGHAAVALADGEIENGILATLFGPALRGASIPFDAAGRSKVACLAVRADAETGHVTLDSLTLQASRLRIEGEGAIDIPGETMDLHMRPEIRFGSLPVKVPVHLTGLWRSPKVEVDKGVLAPGRFGLSIGAASPDPCGPALAAVRQDVVR